MAIQTRNSASFPVKMLIYIYLLKFTSREKSGDYSAYSYYRIGSIESTLSDVVMFSFGNTVIYTCSC